MPQPNLGLWSVRGVPHRGWRCVGVDDLGEVADVCGMCQCTPIRYVHWMDHPDYPDQLGCGCDCAELMEGEYAATHSEYVLAGERQKRMKRVDQIGGLRLKAAVDQLLAADADPKNKVRLRSDRERTFLLSMRTKRVFSLGQRKWLDGIFSRFGVPVIY